jgi:hypothetical protein
VIVFTGEMNGYLRPCGCSLGQNGGLARRSGMLNFLRNDLKLPVLACDTGDLIAKSGPLEELRYEAARKALAELKYHVVGMGKRDFSYSMLRLISKLFNLSDDGPKSVSGNLKAKDDGLAPMLAEKVQPVAVVDVAGVRCAVTSIMDESYQKELSEVIIEPVDQACPKLLQAVNAHNPALRVLLAYMTKAKALELAEKHKGWDIIVSLSDGDDALTQADQRRVGTTLVIQPGRKGKTVGAVGYWPGNRFPLRFAALPVDTRYKNDAKVEEIYNDFVKAIKEEEHLTKWSKIPHASGDQYVGAEVCGKCHTKAYAKWKTEVREGVSHSLAYESLKKDPARYQTHNPECVVCHTTGYEFKGGFTSVEATPHLLGNQCENCHGPGKRHSDHKDNLEFRKAMKLSKFEVEKSICTKCHDEDNDPKFNFAKYWPKVEHPWKD